MNRKQYIEKLRLDAEHWAAKRDELTDRNQKHAARIRQEMCLQHANELEAMDVVWVRPTLIKAARGEIRACESIIIAERRARGLSVDTPETRYRKKLMGDLESAENTNE